MDWEESEEGKEKEGNWGLAVTWQGAHDVSKTGTDSWALPDPQGGWECPVGRYMWMCFVTKESTKCCVFGCVAAAELGRGGASGEWDWGTQNTASHTTQLSPLEAGGEGHNR